MNSNKVKALVEITRPVNVGITAVTIPVASLLAGGTPADLEAIILASLAGALVAAGANAMNDYFDVEIDRINRPQRALPRGAMTERGAFGVWAATSAMALVLASWVNVWTVAICAGAIVVLFVYSARLKRTVLAGNLTIGLMAGMAFVYGAAAVGQPDRALVPAVFAFLVNVAREIIKDIEDVEGDAREQAATLPVRFGIRPALVAATVTIILLVVATVAAYAGRLYSDMYLYIVAAVDILLVTVVVMMWARPTPDGMKPLSRSLKGAMVLGLAAIYFGS